MYPSDNAIHGLPPAKLPDAKKVKSLLLSESANCPITMAVIMYQPHGNFWTEPSPSSLSGQWQDLHGNTSDLRHFRFSFPFLFPISFSHFVSCSFFCPYTPWFLIRTLGFCPRASSDSGKFATRFCRAVIGSLTSNRLWRPEKMEGKEEKQLIYSRHRRRTPATSKVPGSLGPAEGNCIGLCLGCHKPDGSTALT